MSLQGAAPGSTATQPRPSSAGSAGTHPQPSVGGRLLNQRCQHCGADLLHHKRFYKRYRVCEKDALAPSIMHQGQLQRFCQQCGRFHPLSFFDGAMRTCREQLARHASLKRKRRREKAAQRAGKRLPEADSEEAPEPRKKTCPSQQATAPSQPSQQPEAQPQQPHSQPQQPQYQPQQPQPQPPSDAWQQQNPVMLPPQQQQQQQPRVPQLLPLHTSPQIALERLLLKQQQQQQQQCQSQQQQQQQQWQQQQQVHAQEEQPSFTNQLPPTALCLQRRPVVGARIQLDGQPSVNSQPELQQALFASYFSTDTPSPQLQLNTWQAQQAPASQQPASHSNWLAHAIASAVAHQQVQQPAPGGWQGLPLQNQLPVAGASWHSGHAAAGTCTNSTAASTADNTVLAALATLLHSAAGGWEQARQAPAVPASSAVLLNLLAQLGIISSAPNAAAVNGGGTAGIDIALLQRLLMMPPSG